MNKKPSKHRPSKAAPTPKSKAGSSKLKVQYRQDGYGLWHWRIIRGGYRLAKNSESYAKKDKMKRTFLRLVESLKRGEWALDEGVSK